MYTPDGTDYAEYELTWGYEEIQITTEHGAQRPDDAPPEVSRTSGSPLFVEASGFSAEEEAFFCSEVNPVLVIDEPLDSMAERAQASLSRFAQRARSLLTTSSSPARA